MSSNLEIIHNICELEKNVSKIPLPSIFANIIDDFGYIPRRTKWNINEGEYKQFTDDLTIILNKLNFKNFDVLYEKIINYYKKYNDKLIKELFNLFDIYLLNITTCENYLECYVKIINKLFESKYIDLEYITQFCHRIYNERCKNMPLIDKDVSKLDKSLVDLFPKLNIEPINNLLDGDDIVGITQYYTTISNNNIYFISCIQKHILTDIDNKDIINIILESLNIKIDKYTLNSLKIFMDNNSILYTYLKQEDIYNNLNNIFKNIKNYLVPGANRIQCEVFLEKIIKKINNY